LIPVSNAALNISFFTLLRKKIMQLIENFNSLETQQHVSTITTTERFEKLARKRRNAFIIFISTNFCMFLGAVLIFFKESGLPVFITGNTTMIRIFPMYAIQTAEVMMVLFLMLYQIIADLVPSFIYYHAGSVIQAINDEIEEKKELLFSRKLSTLHQRDESNSLDNSMKKEEDSPSRILLQIWSKYDRLRKLIKTTDELFGFMLLVDFGTKFFMICLLSYFLLYVHSIFYIPREVIIASFFVMIIYVIRLVCSVSLMSEVHKSREILTSQTSTHLNTYLLDMDTQVRKVFSFFKSEMNANQLAASPMSLFVVNPALLLTMLSLIVTYLLILLQFN